MPAESQALTPTMLRTEATYPALFTDFLLQSEQQKQRWRMLEQLVAKDRLVALTRVLSANACLRQLRFPKQLI